MSRTSGQGEPIPRQDGNVVVITGANAGIGRATALALARAGASLVLAGRSLERTRPVLDAIAELGGPEARFVALDLADLASVRRAAVETAAVAPRIDVLINNAGLGGHRGATADGFEIQFGVNHLGHFLWTNLLLDACDFPRGGRIVTVASRAHTRIRGLDLGVVTRPTPSWIGYREYCNSKLANVLFSSELGRRLVGRGVSTYAVHPGLVASEIWRRLPGPISALVQRPMLTAEEGARTSLHCATSPAAAAQTGLYYSESAPKAPSRAAQSTDIARDLWRRSAEWVGVG